MRPRRFTVALALAALTGAAVAVLPSISSSAATASSATVTGLDTLMWSPVAVTISAGGSVTFTDPSKSVPHGVVWKSGPETPACSGVPIDEGRTDWTGSCSFEDAGTYEYYCWVHGMNMSGTIYVEGAGGSTTGTGTATTGTTNTTSSTPTSSTSTEPSQGGSMTGMSMPGPGTTSAPEPAGTSPASARGEPRDSLVGGALRLQTHQRASVRGSLEVARAGSSLRISLLAASIATHGRGSRAPAELLVGRLRRSSLPAGRASFEVSLNGLARSLLERRGRLALSVRITLTPPSGASVVRSLAIELVR
jgi:plastocyanin